MNRNNILIIVFAALVLAIALIIALKQPPSPEADGNAVATSTPAAVTITPQITSTIDPHKTPSISVLATPQRPARTPREPVAIDPNQVVDENRLRLDIFGADPVLREEALGKLATLLDKGEGQDLLNELFHAEDPDLREEAMVLLPNLDEKYRLPFILTGLEDADPEYRLDALTQVRDIVEVDISDAMLQAMNDTDEDVLEEVADLFFYFSDKPIYKAASIGLLHPNEGIREEALSYLEDRFTPKSVEVLLAALDSEFEDVRAGAFDALDFLLDADLQSKDPEAWRAWWKENKERWTREEASAEDTW